MTDGRDGRPAQLERLRTLIVRGARSEGVTPSRIPGVVFYRSSRPRPREPMLFDPSICVVASGAKRAFVGAEVYDYDSATYLVLTTSLPLECQVIRASPERPFLSVLIDLRFSDVVDIVVEMDPADRPRRAAPGRSVFVSSADETLLASVVHLLVVENDARDAGILGSAAVRKVLYRVLRDEQGSLLRAAASEADPSHGIARVLFHIRENFRSPLTVEDLAEVGRMAQSTLYARFKRITSMSPMCYVRRLRLHEARRLMLDDGLDAASAGRRVGYRSPAHFSREFKRLFGQPPRRHVTLLRERPATGRRAPR